MHSKNKRAMDAAERVYVDLVKTLPCIVCAAAGPSDAHEPGQGMWFLSVPLCKDDHTGPHGWHGDKSRWRVAKMTELRAINETHRNVAALRDGKPVSTRPIHSRQNGARSPSKIDKRPEAA
jgi:hypothetical protein